MSEKEPTVMPKQTQETNEYGYKALGPANLPRPDPGNACWTCVTPDGRLEIGSTAYTHWIEKVLCPRLDVAVPQEVRQLYLVAQGIVAYGYFYYPLYAIAMEQLWRVLETAVWLFFRPRYAEENGLPENKIERKKYAYANQLEWLQARSLRPTIIKETQWKAIRELRNMASHLEHQMVLPPGHALVELENIAVLVNALFTQQFLPEQPDTLGEPKS